MNMLVDGEWRTDAGEYTNEDGEFERQTTSFRDFIEDDPDARFQPEAGRYHLYVSYACPWAHRTLVVRALKGLGDSVGQSASDEPSVADEQSSSSSRSSLTHENADAPEDAISVNVVDPFRAEDGWQFTPEKAGCTEDTVNGSDYLREVYQQADPDVTGRVTVPVLWDRREETIVNNESAEIMRMLDTEFNDVSGSEATGGSSGERSESAGVSGSEATGGSSGERSKSDGVATRDVDLYPEGYRDEVDRIIDDIYQPINNGVYRTGFANSQKAYDEAVHELFDALDHWDGVLADQRYLAGDRLTEADIAMFTTLVRFDEVYHTHFMCNHQLIREYDNLWPYLRDLYQTADVAETVHMDHIKEHYYTTHPDVSPKRIVPIGPDPDFTAPHDRADLPGSAPEDLLPLA